MSKQEAKAGMSQYYRLEALIIESIRTNEPGGLAPYRPPEAHSRTTRNAELKPRRWRLLRVRICKAPRYGTA